MRYLIIILDGEAIVDGADGAGSGGDDVVAELGRAKTPNLDRLGESGRVGCVATTPGGSAWLGVGMLTLLGYGPSALSGLSPAVFKAAAAGVDVSPDDWVMHLALVGISPEDDEGLMHGLAGVSREEADALFDDLIAHWHDAFVSHMGKVRIIGTGESRILIDRDGPSYANVEMSSPERAGGKPWLEHLPDGGEPLAADRLCTLISASRHFLADHPVNVARAEQGLRPANLVWMWGAGTAAGLSPLHGHVPHETMLLADEPDAVGAGRLIGLEAEGCNGLGSLATRIADSKAEVVFAVVSEDIERVDAELIGPLVSGLGDPEVEPWRLLVSLSHLPGGEMSPFVLAGSWVRSVVPRRLCEGLRSDLRVDPGFELLEYVLRSGMRGRV